MNATQIRAIRKRLGLTQAELSRLVNRTIVTVSSWETGKSRPDDEADAALRKLAEAKPTGSYGLETGSSSSYMLSGKVYTLPASDDPVTDSLRRVLESHGAKPVPASLVETHSSNKDSKWRKS